MFLKVLNVIGKRTLLKIFQKIDLTRKKKLQQQNFCILNYYLQKKLSKNVKKKYNEKIINF